METKYPMNRENDEETEDAPLVELIVKVVTFLALTTIVVVIAILLRR